MSFREEIVEDSRRSSSASHENAHDESNKRAFREEERKTSPFFPLGPPTEPQSKSLPSFHFKIDHYQYYGAASNFHGNQSALPKKECEEEGEGEEDDSCFSDSDCLEVSEYNFEIFKRRKKCKIQMDPSSLPLLSVQKFLQSEKRHTYRVLLGCRLAFQERFYLWSCLCLLGRETLRDGGDLPFGIMGLRAQHEAKADALSQILVTRSEAPRLVPGAFEDGRGGRAWKMWGSLLEESRKTSRTPTPEYGEPGSGTLPGGSKNWKEKKNFVEEAEAQQKNEKTKTLDQRMENGKYEPELLPDNALRIAPASPPLGPPSPPLRESIPRHMLSLSTCVPYLSVACGLQLKRPNPMSLQEIQDFQTKSGAVPPPLADLGESIGRRTGRAHPKRVERMEDIENRMGWGGFWTFRDIRNFMDKFLQFYPKKNFRKLALRFWDSASQVSTCPEKTAFDLVDFYYAAKYTLRLKNLALLLGEAGRRDPYRRGQVIDAFLKSFGVGLGLPLSETFFLRVGHFDEVGGKPTKQRLLQPMDFLCIPKFFQYIQSRSTLRGAASLPLVKPSAGLPLSSSSPPSPPSLSLPLKEQAFRLGEQIIDGSLQCFPCHSPVVAKLRKLAVSEQDLNMLPNKNIAIHTFKKLEHLLVNGGGARRSSLFLNASAALGRGGEDQDNGSRKYQSLLVAMRTVQTVVDASQDQTELLNMAIALGGAAARGGRGEDIFKKVEAFLDEQSVSPGHSEEPVRTPETPGA